MTLWIVLAGMTGLTVLCALWPLAFRAKPGLDAASEAAFYKAQLNEIEQDVERGHLPAEEAAGARAETARRLIAASAASPEVSGPSEARTLRRAAAALILIVVPVLALALYGQLGRPEMPDQPLAERKPDIKTAEGIEAAVARVEAHLAASPDDAKGWSLIAPIYMRAGRFDSAANAYRQVLRLKGENATARADYGEALVGAASGVVTADARAAFEQALHEQPDLPAARFYLGLAAEQDGDKAKAIELYQALVKDAPKGAPWLRALSARLTALQNGAPTNARMPGARPANETRPANEMAAGPTAAQQEMIRGMVEGLAARLAQSGGNASEWERLIRSYAVLHQQDKARDALAAARKALASDAATGRDLDALAHELGIEG